MDILSMYLLDADEGEITPVTVLREETCQRVLNCNLVFDVTLIEPSTLVDMSPELRAYARLGQPNSCWFLCETKNDAYRLLRKEPPDVRWLLRSTKGAASVIPVLVERGTEIIKVSGSIMDTDELLGGGYSGEFKAVDMAFFTDTKTDFDGNPYHPTADDKCRHLRLYDSPAAAETAAERGRAIRRINSEMGRIENLSTETLKGIAETLENAAALGA